MDDLWDDLWEFGPPEPHGQQDTVYQDSQGLREQGLPEDITDGDKAIPMQQDGKTQWYLGMPRMCTSVMVRAACDTDIAPDEVLHRIEVTVLTFLEELFLHGRVPDISLVQSRAFNTFAQERGKMRDTSR